MAINWPHQFYFETLKKNKLEEINREQIIELGELETVKLFHTAYVEHGFIQLHSIGPRGSGKTTLDLKIGYYLFKRLHPGWSDQDIWNEIIKLVVIDLDPKNENSIWPILHHYADRGAVAPLIILDDLAKVLGKYTTFVKGGFNKVKAIAELWEQLRSLASGIAVSSTRPNVIRPILEANTHGAELSKIDKYTSVALVHEYTVGWWKKPRWDAMIEDTFFLHYPDYVRKALDDKRLKEIKHSLDNCKTAFSKFSKQKTLLDPSKVVEAYKIYGNYQDAGISLGVSHETVRSHVLKAKHEGWY